jgi:L-2,4-diaminobutyric acid acetyltransferase
MSTNPTEAPSLTFRAARAEDGAALWKLVRDAGTLELNSAYFYLVFAADFGETCLIAEAAGEPVGAVVGYRPPRWPQSAFVWQVGVSPAMRGKGLGKTLLRQWLGLPGVRDAQWMTATITDDNLPSQKLFKAVARDLGVECTVEAHFTEAHFPEPHPAEHLYRIGPLARE